MTKEARDAQIRKLKDEIRTRKAKIRELKVAKLDGLPAPHITRFSPTK